MDELKPCPFCGGEAKIRTWEEEELDDPCVVVKCLSCGAESNLFLNDSIAENKARAIAAWNRRADDDE